LTRAQEIARELLAEEAGSFVSHRLIDRVVIRCLLMGWALFQLGLARLYILESTTSRIIHLAFAIGLVFLLLPVCKRKTRFAWLHPTDHIPAIGYVLAILSAGVLVFLLADWEGVMARSGRHGLADVILSILLVVLLLEAARRAIGPALSVIVLLFSVYAFLGPHMPAVFAFKGVSVTKYVSKIVLSTEGVFGIPLDVSANTVFLFVLLGAMLSAVGAGHFFNDLALCLLGRFRGGPAKAAVAASGLTGLVSGSSIANVVTTGTFTIPLMKKVGYPAKIAAATEVAASTNGQLMPPIMGAAAFIIAEYLGKAYLDVVKAAAIPAFVSYFALFYITHLEADRLGMKGLPREDIPRLSDVLKHGGPFLIPLGVLLYELMVLRHTPNLSAFTAIVTLAVIVLLREPLGALRRGDGVACGFRTACRLLGRGMMMGSRNMLSVAIATATAGIVVGIVTMGIGSMIVQIVDVLSMGNVFLLLGITAVASLVLGMGLPTTATYIVMASITVPVIVKLSAQTGIGPIPAISAHLFCFYFGILADDTPPVGLAAYTAAAIADSDPIATGIQGFIYDLRTAVIPFMFVFNPELVLHGVTGLGQGTLIFVMAVFGAFAFTNAVQGRFLTRNRWYELPLFLAASLVFFHPSLAARLVGVPHASRYWMYLAAFAAYAVPYVLQTKRMSTPRTTESG